MVSLISTFILLTEDFYGKIGLKFFYF